MVVSTVWWAAKKKLILSLIPYTHHCTDVTIESVLIHLNQFWNSFESNTSNFVKNTEVSSFKMICSDKISSGGSARAVCLHLPRFNNNINIINQKSIRFNYYKSYMFNKVGLWKWQTKLNLLSASFINFTLIKILCSTWPGQQEPETSWNQWKMEQLRSLIFLPGLVETQIQLQWGENTLDVTFTFHSVSTKC